ncbi:Heterokaryon incompatibility protein 6- OR allele [Apiospora saccharicola]
MILETSFSQAFGFSNAYCWFASTAPGEMIQRPENWLNLLYLASNFCATDPRDVIYGLRGLIKSSKGSQLLDPDYSKSTEDVYRDSVEAALLDYENTDALCYLGGVEDSSWVPRWDKFMLFRNPFRFGRPMPWRPAGDTKPVRDIDKDSFRLSLTGLHLGTLAIVEPHCDTYFDDTVRKTENGRQQLREVWGRILGSLSAIKQAPFDREVLVFLAVSFAFGLDDGSHPSDHDLLLCRFVAYLKLVLEERVFDRFVPSHVAHECRDADGTLFGKPIWDFDYPESSFFVTDEGVLGCCMASVDRGDLLFVPLGSTYPHVLHQAQSHYRMRGFAFVHGNMEGGAENASRVTVDIY